MDNLEKFNIAVFGCWNEGCKTNSGQYSVSRLLKSNENKYKFMVILGDNYYAEKVSLTTTTKSTSNSGVLKIKLTNMEEAKHGFECFADIQLEKKLIMGNHDVSDSYDKNCSILKSQLKLPWYDIKFPFSYDLYYIKNTQPSISNTILMIYLDTSLYDNSLNESNSCYHQTTGKTVLDLKIEQNKFISNTIESIISKPIYSVKNVVFFGHEPLLTFKEKKDGKGKIKQKPSILIDLMDILFGEKQKYLNLNFYWICADYHIYQNTEIINKDTGSKINQWIFGTGGGELDDPVSINYFDHSNYRMNILPNIVYDHNHTNISGKFARSNGLARFGYGEISFDLCSVQHKFIQSQYNTLDQIEKIDGGYKQKYIKYKNKYIQLKSK